MSLSASPRVAIVGAGALGLYYGARLARAGADVRLLLRRDLDAVRARGTLRVRENGDTWEAPAHRVAGRTSELGPVDVVLVALKATANAAFRELLPPLLTPQTRVVTLQNGLGNEEQLAEVVGAERTFGALCFIGVNRVGPGELLGFHTPGSITLGEFRRAAGPRAHELAQLFQRAGVKCVAVDDLNAARWRKLVWNVPFNGLTIASGGVATDVICGDDRLRAEARALMEEIVRAAAAHGVAIPDQFVRAQIEVTPPMGPYKPSSLVDYLAGREVEVEPIWGEPLQRARAAGVDTPRLALLYALLKQLTSARQTE